MEQPVVRISVRSLVEFILRSGDIDNRIAAADKDAMQLGSKIHRKIQQIISLFPADLGCLVPGAVVDHNVIKVRAFAHQLLHHSLNIGLFIISRNHHQHLIC